MEGGEEEEAAGTQKQEKEETVSGDVSGSLRVAGLPGQATRAAHVRLMGGEKSSPSS